jgi:hypothetical protein
MIKIISFVLLLMLAGCATGTQSAYSGSHCAIGGGATYACQIEQYQNVL